MQDIMVASHVLVSNVLVPLKRELQRSNDQVDKLLQFTLYQAHIDQPIPIAISSILIDLNKDLNITVKEN